MPYKLSYELVAIKNRQINSTTQTFTQHALTHESNIITQNTTSTTLIYILYKPWNSLPLSTVMSDSVDLVQNSRLKIHIYM